MATFTETRIRNRAQQKTGSYKLAKTVLNEEVAAAKSKSNFDIFLSHSTTDAQIILGVKGVLEDHGNTVYVDWLEDPQLDRSHVTPSTAEVIRARMRMCKSLVYVHSTNSGSSKWMPWELGYFDGFDGAVAILPVTKYGESFEGQEYLGLYPYIDEAPSKGSTVNQIWVNKSSSVSTSWSVWTKNPHAFRNDR